MNSCPSCESIRKALEQAMNRLRNQGGDISEVTHEANMIVHRQCEAALAAIGHHGHARRNAGLDEALNSGDGSYKP